MILSSSSLLLFRIKPSSSSSSSLSLSLLRVVVSVLLVLLYSYYYYCPCSTITTTTFQQQQQYNNNNNDIATSSLSSSSTTSSTMMVFAFATTTTTKTSSSSSSSKPFLVSSSSSSSIRASIASLSLRKQQQQQQRRRFHNIPSLSSLSSSMLYSSSLLSSSSSLQVLRGGALGVVSTTGSSSSSMIKNIPEYIRTTLSTCHTNPNSLFNISLIVLAFITIFMKIIQSTITNSSKSNNNKVTGDTIATTTSTTITKKPIAVQSLQRRFLIVFWLLRCSDWLQGPYFYDVYTSKVLQPDNIVPSMGLISRLFLTGFASTAIFGPTIGRTADTYGRKKATIVFTILYSLGALSTKSSILHILFLGRILSGIGTSLLFSAPESWLVAESQKPSTNDPESKYLGETFSLAYAGDSIVAILAGQMAATAATKRGPTGPFELSAIFLVLGGILTSILWGENKAQQSSSSSLQQSVTMGDNTNDNEQQQQSTSPTIRDAITIVQKDPKIMMVGMVQSLFEAAMYIFVLQWPPAIASAIQSYYKSSSMIPPYGTIFSCFMACCLIGSTLFGQLMKFTTISTEVFTFVMLSCATIAMSAATWTVQQSIVSLPLLISSFFLFEACVGMYFPSIGTLRSRYVPDSHRSVIMNLFGIPLNVLVVSVFLSIHKLGKVGALSISSIALGVASICMLNLNRIIKIKKTETDNNNDTKLIGQS